MQGSHDQRRLEYRGQNILFLIPLFLMGILYLKYFPQTDLWQADSQSYIDFHPARTIGYPILLHMIYKITHGYTAVVLVQVYAYAAACSFFLVRLYSLSPRPLFFFIVLLTSFLIVGHPEILKYHCQIMTESLSLSLLLILIGLWIEFCQNQTPRQLALMSCLVGLSILLRPTHYAHVSLFILVSWILGREVFRFKWLASLTVPLFMMLFLGALAHHKVHGFWATQSFLGHNLIGKVTFTIKEQIPTPEPEKYNHLQKAVIPIQDFVEKAPTFQTKLVLKSIYYDVVRYQVLPSIFSEQRDWNKTWTSMAFSIIRANPLDYIQDVLVTYVSLWFYLQILNTQQADMFQEHLQAMGPMPYVSQHVFKFHSIPPWFLGLFRIGLGYAFLVSLFYLATMLMPSPSSIASIGAGVSLLLHSQYFATALVQAPISRYAIAMWPGIVFICALFLIHIHKLITKESS